MSSVNPYAVTGAPPVFSGPDGGSSEAPNPNSFLAVVIIFAVMGGLGAMSMVGGILGAIFQGFIQQFMPKPTGPSADFMRSMQSVQNTMLYLNIPIILVNGMFGIALIFSSLGIHKRSESARKWAVRFCAFGIIFEIVRFLWATGQQIYMFTVMSESSFMEEGPAAEFMLPSMMIGGAIGLFFALAFHIGKCLMYYFIGRFLKKPNVIRQFS